MGREREHTGIVLSAQEGEVAVGVELCSLCGKVAHANGGFHIVFARQFGPDAVESGVELAPEGHAVALERKAQGGFCVVGLCNVARGEHIAVVVAPRNEHQLQGGPFAQVALDGHFRFHFLFCCAGFHLQFVDIEVVESLERHVAQNAVPVGLCVFRAGM